MAFLLSTDQLYSLWYACQGISPSQIPIHHNTFMNPKVRAIGIRGGPEVGGRRSEVGGKRQRSEVRLPDKVIPVKYALLRLRLFHGTSDDGASAAVDQPPPPLAPRACPAERQKHNQGPPGREKINAYFTDFGLEPLSVKHEYIQYIPGVAPHLPISAQSHFRIFSKASTRLWLTVHAKAFTFVTSVLCEACHRSYWAC